MKLKKLSILPALAILITSFNFCIPAGAAADETDKYNILCSLGFFDSAATFNGDAPVSRGDIITAVVNALPDDKRVQYSSGDTGFTDVDESDSIAEAAYNAHLLGLLGDETELNPYERADIDDASFILLNLLGYGQAAQSTYNYYAASLGLTKGMPREEGFTMSHLAAMLYNALDTEIMQWTPIGMGGKYTTVKGETYMSEILDAGKGKGLVNANQFTGLSGETAAGRGYVKIGGSIYTDGTLPADSYLGNVVDFYYRNTDDDQRQLVYMKLTQEDSVIEFDAEDIVSFENMTYTYESGPKLDKKRRADLAKNADVIYNGKLLDGDYDCYMPAQGSIKLIDNDRNSKYEVVIITDYDVVTVSAVDKDKGIIRSKYNSDVEYQVELYAEYPSYQVILADGTVKKLSDIKKYSTVFIAQSMDKTVTTIIMSEKTITGSVESCSDDVVVIDGITYEVTPDFNQFNSVRPLSYGMFYLDPKGRVGYYDAMTSKGYQAGYLIRFNKDEDTGEETLIRLKVFTENGEVTNLYTADKYYITDGNGSGIKQKADNADDVINALNNAITDGLGGGQLILYKLNSQGRVSEIETAAHYTTDLAESEALDENGTLRQVTNKIKVMHKKGLFLLSSRMNENTKVFSIPSDITKEKKFEVYTGLTNCFEWNKEYTLVSFAKSANAEAADYVLGFLGGGDGAVDEYNIFAVEKVLEGVNDEGDTVKIIKGMWGGSAKEYMLDDTLSENEVNSGDLLRLGFDTDGNVKTMVKVFDNEKRTLGKTGSLNESYYSYAAIAYDFKGSTLRVTPKNPEGISATTDLINTFTDKMPTILHYNQSTKKFETTDSTAIKTYKEYPDSYSTVFASFRYGDHTTMVVYD